MYFTEPEDKKMYLSEYTDKKESTSNMSSNETVHTLHFDAGVVALIVGEIVLGFFNVCTNGICIWLMIQSPQLQVPCNIFILNMCAADVLVGILAPVVMTIVHNGLPHELHACVFVNCLILTAKTVSILALMCVVVDRYVTILYNNSRYRIRNNRTASIINVILWVIAIPLGLLPFFGWYTVPPGEFYYCSYRKVIPLQYNALRFMCLTVPSLLLMLVLHIHMFVTIHRSHQRTRSTWSVMMRARQSVTTEVLAQQTAFTKPSRTRSVAFPPFTGCLLCTKTQRSRLGSIGTSLHTGLAPAAFDKKEMKLFRSLTLMFVLLALCLLPLDIHILMHFQHGADWSHTDEHLFFVFMLLAHTNSVVNPVLYALNQQAMRRPFKNWLKDNLPAWLAKCVLVSVSSKGEKDASECITSLPINRVEVKECQDEIKECPEEEEVHEVCLSEEHTEDVQSLYTYGTGESAVDLFPIFAACLYTKPATIGGMPRSDRFTQPLLRLPVQQASITVGFTSMTNLFDQPVPQRSTSSLALGVQSVSVGQPLSTPGQLLAAHEDYSSASALSDQRQAPIFPQICDPLTK